MQHRADARREKVLIDGGKIRFEEPPEHRPMQCKGVHECLDHELIVIHQPAEAVRHLQPDSKTKEQTDSAAGTVAEREYRDQMLALNP